MVIDHHMKSIAKQRDAPALTSLLEQVSRRLWFVSDQLEQVTTLRGFHTGWRTFSNELPSHHETESITLLCFLEVVRRHQHRDTSIGEAVDHFPERTTRQWIDAGRRLIEKQH